MTYSVVFQQRKRNTHGCLYVPGNEPARSADSKDRPYLALRGAGSASTATEEELVAAAAVDQLAGRPGRTYSHSPTRFPPDLPEALGALTSPAV